MINVVDEPNGQIKQEAPLIIEDDTEKEGYKFLASRFEQILFILLLTFLSIGPILFGESIPSHADWHIHMEHSYNFKKAFFEGQFLPRWIDAHANGYGMPIFNFYAPLPYYLFTFLDLIFRNSIISIKLSFIIPMVLCTVFGYMYLRRHGSPSAVAPAMAFLIFSPAIHIFIYNTNWPGSTLALAFIFLTLYGIDSFDKNKDFDYKSFFIISFSYAAMALTHLASAFVFTLISVPYFLFSLWIHKTRKFVFNFISSMAVGGFLAGFYLFPAALEKKFVHTDEVLTQGPLWDFSKNFLFTYLDRDKDDGFAWGIFDHRFYEVSNGLFGVAVLISVVILLINMDKVKKYFVESFRVKTVIFMFVISFLMMTPISILLWVLIKPMQTIQFPWRYTAFMMPFGLAVMVYAFDLIKTFEKEKIYTAGFKVLNIFLFVLFSSLAYVDFINMYKWKWVPEQSLIKAANYVLWGNEEYMPNVSNNPDWRKYNYKNDFSPTIQSTSPNIDIKIVKWFSHHKIIDVFSEAEHTIRLKIFYFPGWNVFIDKKKADIRLDSNAGAMLVQVPPGIHQIEIKFQATPIRKISEWLSMFALLLCIVLMINPFKKNKKSNADFLVTDKELKMEVSV